ALWMEQGELTLVETPAPDCPGDCVVRVTLAGICGTDLHMRRGYADYTGIPGHEFVGVVEQVPVPAQRHWLGQRVVGDINIGCGTCGPCSRGAKTHCEKRDVLGIRRRHGAFAEYLTLPAANLHPVPDAVDDRAAVFTEPVAAACRILEQIDLGPSRTVAILGDGRMGLLVAQVLATTGAPVVLWGRHDARLTLARSLGLDARLTAAGPLPAAERFDVVVEVTGRADGLERALGCVRPLGTVVMKTTAHEAPAMATWPIVVHEVTIVGSRCGPFLPALEKLASGAVLTGPLIEGVFGLEDFDRAFAAAEHGLKVLFDCAR
ncbi:MAG: alcohol dehydrogenase catalytic domain-containing protein, partial [Vicinamibacterales bacterium]|nr:alcohol dehydrogenase catalytic domain-containing protein [Vicinamibacterales bacterium]